MATLTLRRSNRWFDYARWRKLLIQVEAGLLIPLRSGEEKSISLAPGVYELIAAMDWGRSAPLRIELKEGDSKLVTVRSRLLASWLRVPPFHIFRLEEAVEAVSG